MAEPVRTGIGRRRPRGVFMPSTTAMFTALSGLNANARNIDVIGNNVANVNTTAYKSNRMLFSSVFARTLSLGTRPSATSGGTNPEQIGLGVAIAGTQRDFGGGALSPTGDGRDLAIEGPGFFVVRRGDDQLYTRAGAFRQNSENDLVTIAGDRVLGYMADDRGTIVAGAPVPLNIPVGTRTLAEATENVRFAGNLNASGELPVSGATIRLMGTATTGLSAIAGAVPPPGPGEILAAATRLVDIEDPALPGSGTPLFAAGQMLELNGAEKGGKIVPTARYIIDAASTVQDFMDFLTDTLGLNTSAGLNPDGAAPGLALDPLTGVITATGNPGTVNDLRLDTSDLRLLTTAGALVRAPLVSDKTGSAGGESVRTTFVIYDSLGTPLEVDLAMVIASKSSAGTSWRYYVESSDDTDASPVIATGLLDFDTQGQLSTLTPVSITLDRAGTGAASPLAFDLHFAGAQDNVTALTDVTSEIAASFRDGAPLGTLSAFGVGTDGVITGSFTNGLTRALGQVVLATFNNEDGLVDEGSNLYQTGPNSGSAIVGEPLTLGAGSIVPGALELSNVDLSAEFIQMIQASTGYSASSRVIRTCDELFQQLLALGR